MAQKKIVIQCPCLYTRKGIEELLLNKKFSDKYKIVASISHLDQYGSRLIRFFDVDIIIVTLSSAVDDPVTSLSFFGEFLPTGHPDAKILLIADVISTGVMARYLSKLNNISAALDTSHSLAILETHLISGIETINEAYKPGKVTIPALSQRETTVLRRLLDGEKAAGIAIDLQLSHSTVSAHKHSALKKLSIRSLHPLIMNKYYRKVINEAFSGSIRNK
ncbi:helix-turn-helix transcriptional regulator [Edaphovirga cremea]|uniref:helix-turn-helix transcriptional regulator n=1 Tax=Edaphovirga cremea TaxID=2267246 RepID=UPI000DEF53EF|nr:LuxR C-terminal-related transcriptional regulator [Edaphovirga cremea]